VLIPGVQVLVTLTLFLELAQAFETTILKTKTLLNIGSGFLVSNFEVFKS
jgi:hypothetical protein